MTAQQLRNSILQQAIQGRLVPQDPNDEPASVLLERIRKEKEQLVKEGKLKKKDLVTTPIADDEKPFDIPSTWSWIRLGDIVYNQTGLAYSKGDLEKKVSNPVRVLRGGNIQNGAWCTKVDDVMIAPEFVKKDIFLKKNTFITPAVTSLEHLGKTALIKEDHPDIVAGGFVLYLIPYYRDCDTFVEYLSYFFQSGFYNKFCKTITNKSGQAFWNISRQKLMDLPIPLPPLAEQRRIVAKIEELMPLVEKYGKAQTELDTLNQDLPRRLRQSVLQQAIQGKLVEQDEKDEPIEVILRNFDKKIEYSIDEETPSGWCKISMGQITDFINGLAFKPEDWEEQGLPIVRIQNLSNPYAPCHKTTKVFDGKFKICKGDLLFSWSATLDSFIWEGGDAYLNQHIFKLIPKFFVDKYFLYYLLKAIVNEYKEVTHGSTMKHITKGVFENKIVLLPPLNEQRRIVAKIEELFAEIDKLK